jgi:hypothetical protein
LSEGMGKVGGRMGTVRVLFPSNIHFSSCVAALLMLTRRQKRPTFHP